MPEKTSARRELLVLGVFCGFFFFYGLGAFGLVGADEPRYAQVAREMLQRNDWVTPTLNGQPWLEKPVLYYWGAISSYWLFGVRDWAARVPAAVSASLMVAGVYLLVRRLRAGYEFSGALTATTSAAVFGFARGAGTDMPLAACFTLAMLAWFAWFSGVEREKLWLAAFYFFIAAATLAKGPVAPGLAGIIIFLFATTRPKRWQVLRETLWWPGILLFLAVALPWYVLAQARNPQFFQEFIVQQNLARFSTNLYRHEQPFWYYLPVLLMGLFPWTIFALAAFTEAVGDWRQEDSAEAALGRFLVIWAAVPVIFFSLSQSKLPGYILPAIPAWTLLAAIYLQHRAEHAIPLPGWMLALHALLLAAVSGAVMLAIRWMLHPHEPVPSNVLRTAGLVALAVLALAWVLARMRGWEMLRLGTLLPLVLAAGFVLRVAAPTIDDTQSARPLAKQLAIYPTQTPVSVLGVRRTVEYGLAFYRNQPIAQEQSATGRHLLVAPMDWPLPPGRHRIFTGEFGPQRLGLWWVEAQ